MAKKKKPVFHKIPGGGFIRTDKTSRTTFLQNKDTGRLEGRKRVLGIGDKTRVRRVKRDFTLVKKSKTKRGHTRVSRNKGQIIGRSKG